MRKARTLARWLAAVVAVLVSLTVLAAPAANAGARPVVTHRASTSRCDYNGEYGWKIGDEPYDHAIDYSELWFVCNPRHRYIQDRSECYYGFKTPWWNNSGVVKGVQVVDAAKCGQGDYLIKAQERNTWGIHNNRWTKWATYWKGSPPSPAYTTLWGQRLQVMTVHTPAGDRRYASTVVGGVRRAILNAPVGADNRVYSSPEVCSKEVGPGVYCIANPSEKTARGSRVQVAWHSRANDTASHFYVVLLGYVSRYSPFDIKAFNVAYYDYAVTEFEWVKPSGGGSNLCMATYGSRLRHTTGTTPKQAFWWPIQLMLCTSRSGSDPYGVVMVWKNSGSNGHSIEPVFKVNQTSKMWHGNCVFYTPPQTHCQTGDGFIFSDYSPGIRWAHFNFP